MKELGVNHIILISGKVTRSHHGEVYNLIKQSKHYNFRGQRKLNSNTELLDITATTRDAQIHTFTRRSINK